MNTEPVEIVHPVQRHVEPRRHETRRGLQPRINSPIERAFRKMRVWCDTAPACNLDDFARMTGNR